MKPQEQDSATVGRPSMKPNEIAALSKAENSLWAQAIGGLFLNFGFVEFISHRFVEMLGNDLMLRDVAISMRFGQRIDLIKKLIKRAQWEEAEKENALKLWGEVAEKSEMRNTIAHSPFATGKTKEGIVGSGILNVRQLRGDGPYAATLVQLHDIAFVAARIGELAIALNAFIKEREINAPK